MPNSLAWLLMRSQPVRSRVNGVVEWTVAIEGDTHQSACFDIDVLDTTFAFAKLLMQADLVRCLRKEQRATEPLGAIAIGMIELIGRMHAQASRA